MTKDELINFEKEIGDLFNSAKIRAPIHLYTNNEDQIIDVPSDILPAYQRAYNRDDGISTILVEFPDYGK